jgi:hypothetical protein
VSETIPIQRVSVLEIKCSFCSDHRREDARTGDDYYNQDWHFSEAARRAGWTHKDTAEGYRLTLCPDHKNSFMNANIV